jgi:hypothetical protein
VNEVFVAALYSLFLASLFAFLFFGGIVMILDAIRSGNKKSRIRVAQDDVLHPKKMFAVVPGFIILVTLSVYTWQMAWPLDEIVRYTSVRYVPFYGWSMLVASMSFFTLSFAIIVKLIVASRRGLKQQN